MTTRTKIRIGVLVLIVLAIPVFRWANTPIPQVLTVQKIKGDSINVVVTCTDGMFTFINVASPKGQRLTLQKLFDEHSKFRNIRIMAEPANTPLLEELAASLRSMIPYYVIVKESKMLIDLGEKSDQDSQIENVEKIYQQCFQAIGVSLGDKYILDYTGGYDLHAVSEYGKRKERERSASETEKQK